MEIIVGFIIALGIFMIGYRSANELPPGWADKGRDK
jgi:hypothetical protein